MFSERVGDVAHEADGIGLGEDRRHLAHRHGTGPETFKRQARGFQFDRMRQQPLDIALIHLDDGGNQQKLACNAGFRALAFQPLVDQALMGGMLIDDDDAIARLGDNIGVMQLRARGAERRIERIRQGCRIMRAHIGHGG